MKEGVSQTFNAALDIIPGTSMGDLHRGSAGNGRGSSPCQKFRGLGFRGRENHV